MCGEMVHSYLKGRVVCLNPRFSDFTQFLSSIPKGTMPSRKTKHEGLNLNALPERPSKVQHALSPSSLQFLNLRYDIRHKIYLLCLITSRTISLRSSTTFEWLGRAMMMGGRAQYPRTRYASRINEPAYQWKDLKETRLYQGHEYHDSILFQKECISKSGFSLLVVCSTIYRKFKSHLRWQYSSICGRISLD